MLASILTIVVVNCGSMPAVAYEKDLNVL